MHPAEKEIVTRLTRLTGNNKILWIDESEVISSYFLRAYYKDHIFEVLSVTEESPKLFIKTPSGEEMTIVDDVPCSICNLICAICAQFRRDGIEAQPRKESNQNTKYHIIRMLSS